MFNIFMSRVFHDIGECLRYPNNCPGGKLPPCSLTETTWKLKLHEKQNYMKIEIWFKNIYQTKSTSLKHLSNLIKIKETELTLNVFSTY